MRDDPARRSTDPVDRDFVAALAHGLSVLEAVAQGPGSVSLADLAKRVGLKKTSTWRLARTLVRLGYVLQNSETRQFQPAFRILSLGHAFFGNQDVQDVAGPFLQSISDKLNETVSLALRDEYELIYVHRIQTNQILSVNLRVGSRLPLYSTALGRALILDMTESWLSEYLHELRKDQKAREYIGADGRRLRGLLIEARKLGFAMNDQELVKGLRAIAAPIRDRNKQIVAAVGVVVPSTRATVAELRKNYAREVLGSAREISLGLGYRSE